MAYKYHVNPIKQKPAKLLDYHHRTASFLTISSH